MYDAIIVGARIAGSATAILLAKAGHKILLVDRATFPSNTLSSHFFWATAHRIFDKLGVLPQIEATGAPGLLRHRSESETRVIDGEYPAVDGHREARCVRRILLDKILIDAARRHRNIDIRENFMVQDLLWEDRRVVGIRGRDAKSDEAREQAKIVIGADGHHSLVARLVKAPEYDVKPMDRAFYFAYYSGMEWLDPPRGILLARRAAEYFVLPADSGLTTIAYEFPKSDFEAFRKDHEKNFETAVRAEPRMKELLGGAVRESPVWGTADLTGFFRKGYGPGWALVGDSGHYLDPEPAQGIGNALRSAEILAEQLGRAWGGEVSEELALWTYEKERDAALKDMHALIYHPEALLPPSSVRREFMRIVSQDPELSSRWLGLYNGATDIAQFYSPENVARVIDRSRVF